MTLEQIQQSSPEFKAGLQMAVEGKEINLVLSAVKGEINRRIGLAPVPKVGQTYDGAVSNWHSYLHGMQTVVPIMEGIGAMPNHQMPPAGDEEQPFEHAIDPRLSEARKKGFRTGPLA